MSRFAVWAPDHRSVDVEVAVEGSWRRHPLRGPSGGWWHGEVVEAGPGTRYGFSVDGGPRRPDPRARWQPEGIDGPSSVVDDGAFAWNDGGWHGARLGSAVVYELHVGTFSPAGTFAGVIEHLDHLVDLGVTAIEVLPVAEFSGERGWGYDGVLLWAPHHAYGGPDGFKGLVDEAHRRGLAVILDVVYNHLGPAGNYLGEYGPYFTDRYRTPWGSAVNFDGAGSDEVRRFVIDNASMWFENYHVDGLRLDAVHAIYDDSALPVLEELAVAVGGLADRLGRPLWLIAESDRNDPRLVTAREAGGFGLDATWNDDFHHALHAALTGERTGYYEDYGALAQVGRALEDVYVYGRHFSPFRDRHHGRPVGDLPRGRFLAYLQNHDQIGNRAVGERSAALMSVGRLKVGAALVLCGPCVPMLFQGEEWAASTPFQYFTDHQDPALGRAVSEGRRGEFAAFGWQAADVPDPQAAETRDRSVLAWSELDEPVHRDMLAWHRSLIALRRAMPDLADTSAPNSRVRLDEHQGWLQLRRGAVQISINLAGEDCQLSLPGPAELLAASDPAIRLDGPSVIVAADAVAITRTLGAGTDGA